MSGALAGTGTLLRFALRRDRIRLPLWIAGLWLFTVSSVADLESSYGTAQDRAELANTMDSPAMLALTGPAHYLSDYTYGAMAAHQLIGFFAIFTGLMSALLVVRHTRAEEETGRAELVRSGVVGRHAPLTAALTLAVAANVALGLLLWVSLNGLGMAGVTSRGSLLLGAAFAATGIVFAAIAAVAAQITPFARGASGTAFAAIGVSYVLRAVGDAVSGSGGDVLSWLSPIGWAQRTYAYVDDRWWPLLLDVALAVAAAAAAYALSTRRDVGAGLRPPRPGRPAATPALSRPLGLAVRLQRGVVAAFAAGLLLFGLMYGSILGAAEDIIEDNEELRQTVRELGGSLAESFASAIMSFLAIIAACLAVASALRARAEETSGRAEPVLATGVSRSRWAGSHLAVALGGSTAAMLLGGIGFGLAGAASAGDGSLVAKLTGASLAYAPALWLTAGAAVALFGWLPRFSAAAWVIPAYAFVVVYLAELIDMPDWLARLSPLGHVPQVPAADWEWTPLLVMTALAVVLAAVGLVGFRRRDVECR